MDRSRRGRGYIFPHNHWHAIQRGEPHGEEKLPTTDETTKVRRPRQDTGMAWLESLTVRVVQSHRRGIDHDSLGEHPTLLVQ